MIIINTHFQTYTLKFMKAAHIFACKNKINSFYKSRFIPTMLLQYKETRC